MGKCRNKTEGGSVPSCAAHFNFQQLIITQQNRRSYLLNLNYAFFVSGCWIAWAHQAMPWTPKLLSSQLSGIAKMCSPKVYVRRSDWGLNCNVSRSRMPRFEVSAKLFYAKCNERYFQGYLTEAVISLHSAPSVSPPDTDYSSRKGSFRQGRQ